MVAPRKTNAAAQPAAPTASGTDFLILLPNLGEPGSPEINTASQISAATETAPTLAAADLHPAFAELAQNQPRAQNVARPEEQATAVHHHVDQAHLGIIGNHYPDSSVDEELNSQVARQLAARKARIDMPRTMAGQSPGASAGWLGFFGKLDERVAPYAGLIVTLALLSCAGLLFWLISDHRQAEFDLRELGITDDTFSVDAVEIEPVDKLPAGTRPLTEQPFTEQPLTEQPPAFAPTMSTPASESGAAEESGAALAMSEPTAASADEQPRTEPAESEPAPLGYLQYPRTSTPDSLAFEHAVRKPKQSSEHTPLELPEVAGRDNRADASVAR